MREQFRAMTEQFETFILEVIFEQRRGKAAAMTRAVQPLAAHGHDIMILQVLDPQEIEPQWRESVVLQDLETQQTVNVAPEYLEDGYRRRLASHLDSLRSVAASAGAHHALLSTAHPLDDALRRYLSFRQRRN